MRPVENLGILEPAPRRALDFIAHGADFAHEATGTTASGRRQ
jgi:hypothetical protein